MSTHIAMTFHCGWEELGDSHGRRLQCPETTTYEAESQHEAQKLATDAGWRFSYLGSHYDPHQILCPMHYRLMMLNGWVTRVERPRNEVASAKARRRWWTR